MSCSDGHGGTEARAARGLPQLCCGGPAHRRSPEGTRSCSCLRHAVSHSLEERPSGRSAAYRTKCGLLCFRGYCPITNGPESGAGEAHDQHDETKHGDYKPVGIDTDVVVERWRVMRSHDEQHHEHQHGPYQPTH